jgi:hypothetical protein
MSSSKKEKKQQPSESTPSKSYQPHKLCHAKLEKLKQKLSGSGGDAKKLEEVNKHLAILNNWYSELKSQCPLTEGDLKKALKADAKKVLDNANRLIEEKDNLKIEITDSEKKNLERARKWA